MCQKRYRAKNDKNLWRLKMEEIIETSLVTLPKMEFVFDSAKITPAKIDKDMIDFEKSEEKVEEIEKL